MLHAYDRKCDKQKAICEKIYALVHISCFVKYHHMAVIKCKMLPTCHFLLIYLTWWWSDMLAKIIFFWPFVKMFKLIWALTEESGESIDTIFWFIHFFKAKSLSWIILSSCISSLCLTWKHPESANWMNKKN